MSQSSLSPDEPGARVSPAICDQIRHLFRAAGPSKSKNSSIQPNHATALSLLLKQIAHMHQQFWGQSRSPKFLNWEAEVKTLFFLLTILMSFVAKANLLLPDHVESQRNATCETVDLGASFGKVHLQGDSAICFAYACADMITQRTKIETSPLAVASLFYFADANKITSISEPDLQSHLRQHPEWRENLQIARNEVEVSSDSAIKLPFFDHLEGGDQDSCAYMVNGTGICAEQNLPSDGGIENYAELFEKFRDGIMEGSLPDLLPVRNGQPFQTIALQTQSNPTDKFNSLWFNYMIQRCHSLPSPTPLLPLRYSVAHDVHDLLSRVMKDPKAYDQEREKMLGVIDYALDHDRSPTIGYSFDVFQPRDSDDTDSDVDHASAVIARKKIGNTCYYKIRETSGEDCATFFPKFAKRCHDHHVWLSEEEISSNLYDVTFLR
jgi:hypothetical protein